MKQRESLVPLGIILVLLVLGGGAFGYLVGAFFWYKTDTTSKLETGVVLVPSISGCNNPRLRPGQVCSPSPSIVPASKIVDGGSKIMTKERDATDKKRSKPPKCWDPTRHQHLPDGGCVGPGCDPANCK